MNVKIDAKAEKFIKSKGEDSITVWLEGCSSWGTKEPMPSVRMGKPDNINEYNHYQIGDINVYVKSDVVAKDDELKIKCVKLLWKEKLVVEGMVY